MKAASQLLFSLILVGCHSEAEHGKGVTQSMTIRKQVYELAINELRDYPVWEYALDEEDREGQDEATVRPVILSAPLDPNIGMFIVRTRFKLADGTLHFG